MAETADIRRSVLRNLRFKQGKPVEEIRNLYLDGFSIYKHFPKEYIKEKCGNLSIQQAIKKKKLPRIFMKMFDADLNAIREQNRKALLLADSDVDALIDTRAEYREMLKALYQVCLENKKESVALNVLDRMMDLDNVLKEEKPQIESIHFHISNDTDTNKKSLDTSKEILANVRKINEN